MWRWSGSSKLIEQFKIFISKLQSNLMSELKLPVIFWCYLCKYVGKVITYLREHSFFFLFLSFLHSRPPFYLHKLNNNKSHVHKALHPRSHEWIEPITRVRLELQVTYTSRAVRSLCENFAARLGPSVGALSSCDLFTYGVVRDFSLVSIRFVLTVFVLLYGAELWGRK